MRVSCSYLHIDLCYFHLSKVFMVRLLRSGNFTGEETEILQKIKNGAEKVVPKAIKSYDEMYKVSTCRFYLIYIKVVLYPEMPEFYFF